MNILPFCLLAMISCCLADNQLNSWCKRPSSMSYSELLNNNLEMLHEFRIRGYKLPWSSYSYYSHSYGQGNGYGNRHGYGTNMRGQCRCENRESGTKCDTEKTPPSSTVSSEPIDHNEPTSTSKSATEQQTLPSDITFLDD